MGTTGAYTEAREVIRDDLSSVGKLNATAQALQLTDRLAEGADSATVDAFKAKVKAAVDGITK